MSEPDASALWASLPLPALLVGPDNRISEVNPAAETFLNLSSRSLVGHPVLDRLSIAESDVTTGERAPVQCALQVAPLQDAEGVLILLISPREIADRLGRSLSISAAAKSAIG